MKSRTGEKIVQMALPLILQQLCLQLQIWIDRAMLGHMNAEYFSAIGNTLVPYQMVTSTIIAICGGTTILVAHGAGAKDHDGIRETAEASFLGNSLLSAVAFLFFLLCAEELFRLMGVQGQILTYSIAYIRILSVSMLFLGLSATATAVLQGLGFTRIIMASGLAGNTLNIILDYLLIFGKLGFPALGLEGAAIATVIANGVAAALAFWFVLRSRAMPVRLRFGGPWARKWSHYGRVLRLGIPSGLEFGLWNMGNLILVSYLNRLDAMAAGIYTLVFSVETVPILIYMGFANAGLTLVGQKTGANDPKQAKQAGLLCLLFSLCVCVVIALVFCFFPRQLLGLFTNDGTILETSVPYLVFISWILFPKAVNNVIGLCIRGMGDTRWMLCTQIFGTFFMIGAGYYLILCTGLGLMGIFVTLLADETLRGIANLARFCLFSGTHRTTDG